MSPRHATRRLVMSLAMSLGLDGMSRARIGRALRHRDARLARVLFFHGTPPSAADRFRRQLAWLVEHFEVIDFRAFTELFVAGGSPRRDRRPAALLTFDDGLASNYEVAAPILEQAGVRGVFFVVPAFSSAERGHAARRFFVERIRGRWLSPGDGPMTPAQIRELADRGHTIGNHTFSHARLSDTPAAEYGREILESAAVIESWIDRPVEAFAWPFVWDAITPEAHRVARERHAFCFSPCAGIVNARADSPGLIWRTNAEASRSFDEFRFQCSGLADPVAAARRHRLRRLLPRHPAGGRGEARSC